MVKTFNLKKNLKWKRTLFQQLRINIKTRAFHDKNADASQRTPLESLDRF
jgi:flagellar biosynthesis/type III secretory pathway chaperone